ncbi:MAG: hypothetical protein HC817_05465 [Saprospiraceae bacterium]|nr:hypothetical protein [Saprospiraceae bacterium]
MKRAGNGQHPDYHRQCRHYNRTQAAFACFEQRFFHRFACFEVKIGSVN